MKTRHVFLKGKIQLPGKTKPLTQALDPFYSTHLFYMHIVHVNKKTSAEVKKAVLVSCPHDYSLVAAGFRAGI